MNKELIVTLLRKNIHELDQLTSGFDEMDRIPSSILLLAKEKMADITVYLEQLNAPASPVEKDMIADIKPVEKIPPIVTVTVETEKPKVEPTTSGIEKAENKDLQVSGNKDIRILPQPDEQPTEKPTVARNEAFTQPDNSFNAAIGSTKIDDVRQVLSIGDRFRFQRELFNGNGEEMSSVLNRINQLQTVEEAHAYLQSKYNWDNDDLNVVEFYQLIYRRFQNQQ